MTGDDPLDLLQAQRILTRTQRIVSVCAGVFSVVLALCLIGGVIVYGLRIRGHTVTILLLTILVVLLMSGILTIVFERKRRLLDAELAFRRQQMENQALP